MESGTPSPKSVTIGRTYAAHSGLFSAEFIVVMSSALVPTTFVVHAIAATRSPFYFGILGSLYFVGVFLSYIFGPSLLARLSFRWIGIVATPSIVAGSLTGLIDIPEVWLLGRLLIGFGSGLFFLIYAAYVIAQILLLFVPPSTDGPIVIALICATCGIVVLGRIRKPNSVPPKVESPYRGARLIIQHAPESMFMTFASGLLIGANGAFVPAYAVAIGLPADQVSLFSLANMMGALIAQPFLGRLANRFGPHRVLIGMSLLTATTSVILYHVSSWGWSTALVALLWGATGSTGYATGASIAHAADHGRHPVEVARIALILNGLGGILGPLLATLFVRRFDAEGLYIFAMIVALTIIIVMAIKNFFLIRF
jgi:MFS family permease